MWPFQFPGPWRALTRLKRHTWVAQRWCCHPAAMFALSMVFGLAACGRTKPHSAASAGLPLTTLEQLDATPERYTGKKVRVRGRAYASMQECIFSGTARCWPQAAMLAWFPDPNSMMPDDTLGYVVELRGRGDERFECSGSRKCSPLQWDGCYEVIGLFRQTSRPRMGTRLELEVESYSERPDGTDDCGWDHATWNPHRASR